MKSTSIIFAAAMAAAVFTGCTNIGQTDPVLSGYRQDYPQPAAVVAETPAPRQTDSFNSKRELASFKADLDAVAEEQKMLTARIMGLEQDIQRKDLQIKELQSLLDAMDKRFADVDSNWRNRMKELSSNIDKEREARLREQKQFTQAVSQALADQSSSGDSNYSEFAVLTVQRGDTLGKIALAAKVSVAELKRINNLKSDMIRENQKLKVPVKK